MLLQQAARSCSKLHADAAGCTRLQRGAASYSQLQQDACSCNKVQRGACVCSKLHAVVFSPRPFCYCAVLETVVEFIFFWVVLFLRTLSGMLHPLLDAYSVVSRPLFRKVEMYSGDLIRIALLILLLVCRR